MCLRTPLVCVWCRLYLSGLSSTTIHRCRPHTERARQEEVSRQINMVFEQVDDDGNGTLDIDEFEQVCRALLDYAIAISVSASTH